MEILTIVVTDNAIKVVDGREPNSRVKYHGGNLEIRLVGKVPARRRDAVNHIAFQNFLARHIPLRSVYSEGWA